MSMWGYCRAKPSHALTELRRVAHLEHTLEPVARLDRRHELEWMRAVDAVESGPVITCLGVDDLDRVLQGRP
jgi:hypothetical protein